MKIQYPDPWPYGFGSAQNVVSHSSNTVGTTYGNWDIDCTVCHNPHSQEQDNKYKTSYGKLIKRFICFDNQATGGSTLETIQFTSNEGPGSFADGAPYNENICETCHTLTNHHRNDGLAPGDLDETSSYVGHEDENDCAFCHPHSQGFKPDCGGCHDVPPPTGTHLVHYGGTPEQAGYGNTQITQDLSAQETVYIMNCGNCHPMDPASHMNSVPNSGGGSAEIELYNPSAPAGSLKAMNPPTAAYTPGGTVFTDASGLDYTQGTCSNVYCHSYTEFSTSGPVPFPTVPPYYPPLVYDPPWETLIVKTTQYQSPTWGADTLGCDGCHGNPITTAYPTVSAGAGDSHSWIDDFGDVDLHTWNMGYAPLQCNTCHNDTVVLETTYTRDGPGLTVFDDVPIDNTATHINGEVNIAFTPFPILYPTSGGDVYHDLSTATFDPLTSTCFNVACHDKQTEVKWGTPYRYWDSWECNVCHQM
jgi:predicted CxxxxCH...CXXCH cytochrome family protein